MTAAIIVKRLSCPRCHRAINLEQGKFVIEYHDDHTWTCSHAIICPWATTPPSTAAIQNPTPVRCGATFWVRHSRTVWCEV